MKSSPSTQREDCNAVKPRQGDAGVESSGGVDEVQGNTRATAEVEQANVIKRIGIMHSKIE